MTTTTDQREVQPPQLFRIPAGTKPSKCAHPKCGATIYRVGKQPLRAAPRCHYLARNVIISTPDAVPPTRERDGAGFSHFIDCPEAGSFRK